MTCWRVWHGPVPAVCTPSIASSLPAISIHVNLAQTFGYMRISLLVHAHGTMNEETESSIGQPAVGVTHPSDRSSSDESDACSSGKGNCGIICVIQIHSSKQQWSFAFPGCRKSSSCCTSGSVRTRRSSSLLRILRFFFNSKAIVRLLLCCRLGSLKLCCLCARAGGRLDACFSFGRI